MSSENSILTVITFSNKSIDLIVNLKSTTPEMIVNLLVQEHGYKCSEPLALINFSHNEKKFNSLYQSLWDLGIKSNNETIKMYINFLAKTKYCYPSEELIRKSETSTTQIFVKNINGKTITVSISPDMRIVDIKKLITLKTEFPFYSFHLLRSYRNRVKMEDFRTVSDYMITKEESFEMILRLRGGAVRESFGNDASEKGSF